MVHVLNIIPNFKRAIISALIVYGDMFGCMYVYKYKYLIML